jgi:hypothetical protein
MVNPGLALLRVAAVLATLGASIATSAAQMGPPAVTPPGAAPPPGVAAAPPAIPAPQAEVVPAPPPGPVAWVWQPGHRHWNGFQYVWRPGRYVRPHPHRIAWIEGHWALRHGGWVWIPGHWG